MSDENSADFLIDLIVLPDAARPFIASLKQSGWKFLPGADV
jgi:hypothetical protein